MVDILDAMIDGWVNQIVMVIGQMPWLGPLLALIAGVLAAFTPCCLSSIPLIVGYISGLGEKTTKRAFLYSLTFAGGTACTFVALGLIATSVGHLLGTDSVIWHIILGLLMFLMALQIWDVINIIPETDVLENNRRRGFVGAFLTGILAGIFASPCSTPILVALLAIIAGDGRFFWGILLMLCYAAGHSVLVLIAGTSVGSCSASKVAPITSDFRFGAKKSSAPSFLPLASICSGLLCKAKRLRSGRCVRTQAFVYSSLILLNTHSQIVGAVVAATW